MRHRGTPAGSHVVGRTRVAVRAGAVFIAALLVLSLSSCGEDAGSSSGSDGATGSGDTGAVDLSGTYVADTVDSASHQLVRGTTVRLTFADGNVSVQAGCNTMSGTATVEDDLLVVDNLGGTEMGCPKPRMAQDAWLVEVLTSSPRITSDAGTVTLTSDDTTIVLTEEVAAMDLPLEDTVWRLDTVLTGAGADGTASSVPQDARDPMLRIRNTFAGWEATFSTGCNGGSGPVKVGDEVLNFGALVTTRMACPGDVGQLEQTFLGVLGQGTTYVIDGDVLTLTAADGKSGLGFRAG